MEQHGVLLIIGGAEDKSGECTVLRRFVDLAGGGEAVIAILTAAAEAQTAVGEEYRDIFVRLGARAVEVCHVANRQQANDLKAMMKVRGATGVYFTGGDQLRITSLVGGTLLDELLKEIYLRGAVIAGTSAGASAMSDSMIVAGDGEEEPRREAIRMAPGLGLLKHTMVDQHFAQRGRIGRLLGALAQNPDILGIGIDEDTAIEVSKSGRFTVVGNGCVTVLDGRGITISDISDTTRQEPLALCDVLLHVLPADYTFNLATRRPASPKEEAH